MSEIERLREELKAERLAREEAESQVQQWRRKSIDSKLEVMNSRTSLSRQREESLHSTTPSRNAEEEIAVLKKENESLIIQRDRLAKTIEELKNENPAEDTSDNDPEALEKERRSRRASDAMVETLRVQVEQAEKRRSEAERNAEKYSMDLERMKSLLASAEELIIQNRMATGGTENEKENNEVSSTPVPVRVSTRAPRNGYSLLSLMISSVAMFAAGASSVAIYYRKKK